MGEQRRPIKDKHSFKIQRFGVLSSESARGAVWKLEQKERGRSTEQRFAVEPLVVFGHEGQKLYALLLLEIPGVLFPK